MKLLKTHQNKVILLTIVLFGLLLRIYPGSESLIWSYDQARDSVVIRSIIGEKNIIIVGPQTEYVGLSHGPLYYYLLAPFYHLGQTNLSVPLMFMVLFNLSTVVPIFLLVKSFTKGKIVPAFLASFLFVVAYQQVEYGRWLSNVSITIPFLGWFYYLLWQSIFVKKQLHKKISLQLTTFLTGLALALAIQGEIFLLYLIPFVYFFFFKQKTKLQEMIYFHVGLALGLSSFLVAELSFGFLATKTFFGEFLGGHSASDFSLVEVIQKYVEHMGLVTYQNVFGFSIVTGFASLVLATIYYLTQQKKREKLFHTSTSLYVLTLLFSHSILFIFQYIDSVFLDISITIPVVLFTTIITWMVMQSKKVAGLLLVVAIVMSQLMQLYSNTQAQTPMQVYKFHQGAILFSQKKEIVKTAYELFGTHSTSEGQRFTLGVLGSPYGVQTTWATIFENYLAENSESHKPDWFGFHAYGYPYDEYFTKVDHPEDIHIVIVEDNVVTLTNEKIVGEYLAHVDESTEVVEEREIHGFVLQVRKKIKE